MKTLILTLILVPMLSIASVDELWSPEPPGTETFLREYPDMAALLHAFDYGHALIYEELWKNADSGKKDFNIEDIFFDINDKTIVSKVVRILQNPPSQKIEEASLAPTFYRQFNYLVDLFDWNHKLHWVAWDLFAAHEPQTVPPLMQAQVENVYKRYSRLALPETCKSMNTFMDNYNPQYSRKFRSEYPIANGLIWAYHFVQLRIYEGLMQKTQGARRAHIEDTYKKFYAMLEDIPFSLPQTMPMTQDHIVAPNFWTQYKSVAIIFDNLHMLHDVVGDLLTDYDMTPKGMGSREKKKAELHKLIEDALNKNYLIAPDCDDNNHTGPEKP